MNIDHIVKNITPEVFERLQYGASTGKWPDGTPLTDEQKQQTVQLVMLYQAKVSKPMSSLPLAQMVKWCKRAKLNCKKNSHQKMK